MAKVDLESAYRSVRIHTDNYQATGIKFKFPGNQFSTYIYDTRLPFGARKSLGIFNRITQAVKRMMIRKGHNLMILYLDDWLILGPDKESCSTALNILLKLLRELGFSISYNKVVPPTTALVFLSILIDSQDVIISLPHEKVGELEALISHFANSKHATKRQLQSLAGKLNWACQVVRGVELTSAEYSTTQACLLNLTTKLSLRMIYKQISNGGIATSTNFMVKPYMHVQKGIPLLLKLTAALKLLALLLTMTGCTLTGKPTSLQLPICTSTSRKLSLSSWQPGDGETCGRARR